MSRILSEFNKTLFLSRNSINNKLIYNSVRNHLKKKRKEPFRKPVWTTIAPSKLFRIRTKEELTEEEEKQRQHFDQTYDYNMRSIREYFKHEFYLPTLTAGGLTSEQVSEEEKEQLELFEENKRENERMARIRAERSEEHSKLLEQQLIVSELQEREDWKQKGVQLDEMVKQEIIRSKTYITHETLESAIEEALANPVNYDYAVDIDGNIHFENTLHPYALRPTAIPETSSNTAEFADNKNIVSKLEPKQLY